MVRRCADYACLLIGGAMVVIGGFFLFFPEITYTSAGRGALNTGRQSRRTIVVPPAFSAAIVLAGAALMYNSIKIRKREARDGMDKEDMF
ncbi:MAG: hypothetical protein HZB84_04300 [Deltaproteobacteria bacterium]|nr:hypothetical protein [Deltaproteobacteria bacterium]